MPSSPLAFFGQIHLHLGNTFLRGVGDYTHSRLCFPTDETLVLPLQLYVS
jgi:hypothetical protein